MNTTLKVNSALTLWDIVKNIEHFNIGRILAGKNTGSSLKTKSEQIIYSCLYAW